MFKTGWEQSLRHSCVSWRFVCAGRHVVVHSARISETTRGEAKRVKLVMSRRSCEVPSGTVTGRRYEASEEAAAEPVKMGGGTLTCRRKLLVKHCGRGCRDPSVLWEHRALGLSWFWFDGRHIVCKHSDACGHVFC